MVSSSGETKLIARGVRRAESKRTAREKEGPWRAWSSKQRAARSSAVAGDWVREDATSRPRPAKTIRTARSAIWPRSSEPADDLDTDVVVAAVRYFAPAVEQRDTTTPEASINRMPAKQAARGGGRRHRRAEDFVFWPPCVADKRYHCHRLPGLEGALSIGARWKTRISEPNRERFCAMALRRGGPARLSHRGQVRTRRISDDRLRKSLQAWAHDACASGKGL